MKPLEYEFPYITDMEPFERLAHDDPEFVNRKHNEEYGYILYSYSILGKNQFFKDGLAPYRLETRGICFDDKTGMVIRRPCPKFFNLGEFQGVEPKDLDGILDPNGIQFEDKVDGSMASPIYTNKSDIGYILATKRDDPDFRELIKSFTHSDPGYKRKLDEFILYCKENLITPNFEFVSPNAQIVIEHQEPALYWLNARHMHTGQYVSLEVPNIFKRPHRDQHKGSVGEFVQNTRTRTDTEGFVLVLPNQHRVKVKSEWYSRIHYLLTEVYINEKFLIKTILDEQMDDLKPLMKPMIRPHVEEFEKDFEHAVDQVVDQLDDFRAMLDRDYSGMDDPPKAFKFNIDNFSKVFQDFGFIYLNGKFSNRYGEPTRNNLRQYILDSIHRNTDKRNKKFREVVLEDMFNSNLTYRGPKKQKFSLDSEE